MYQYDVYDHTLVSERVAQFRDQVARRLSGELGEDEFKPFRLQNGLYMQLHAYMLRVAIPYGLISSAQMRTLATIARRWDRGYGHFTTRQNIQYNWPRLVDVPDILAALAEVEMHAIQTSGNCIRNVTADHLAGVARDEIADPRPLAELVRQWSTFHPEFAFLPRKFKIAVSGSAHDRTALRFHDIGIQLVRRGDDGALGAAVYVGGGLGRTPKIAKVCREWIDFSQILSYLEAILRVYNRWGRRDNAYKARIKILVEALDIDTFKQQVEEEWQAILASGEGIDLTAEEIDRVTRSFAPPAYRDLPDADRLLSARQLSRDRAFGRWVAANVLPHRQRGYVAVAVSLKPHGGVPGDITADQMDALADLAEEFSFGEIVATHTQNLLLPHVEATKIEALWRRLAALELAAPNFEKASDIIACPGLDYCSLANARSIPVAQRIALAIERFDDEHDLGDVSIKMSGCINACGHHHVGNIGILGIDKGGEEFYQLMLGGSPGEDAAVGKVLGPALSTDEIVPAVTAVLQRFLALREDEGESFLDCVRRLGFGPFREEVYGRKSPERAA